MISVTQLYATWKMHLQIFIEHRGSSRHPWLCCLAESADEKRELEKLYWQLQPNDYHYVIENNIEWQQQNFKLMFMLEVDEIPEASGG